MALQLKLYALTTLANLKDRLQLTTTGFDTSLTRLINQQTDWLEAQCGNRQFVSRTGNTVLNTYTHEVYDGGTGGRFLYLRQAPVFSLALFQWRAGVPTNPAWTDFVPVTYELDQTDANGMCRTGMIRVYGGVPTGSSNIRATYTAGYAVDWANEGSATHTLPSDLTDICEQLCVREFTQRNSFGKAAESAEKASTTWMKDLDKRVEAKILEYTRPQLYT
jgi:hypothetical protein